MDNNAARKKSEEEWQKEYDKKFAEILRAAMNKGLNNTVGLKYDNNKPSLSLIDPSFLEGLAKVLDFGKEKYGADNWRSGISVSRLISACYRHLGEINRRSDLDTESGLHHVYHLAANVMFLAWTLENRKEFDDRYKPTNTCRIVAQRNVEQSSDLPPGSWVEVDKYLRPLQVAKQKFNLGDNPA